MRLARPPESRLKSSGINVADGLSPVTCATAFGANAIKGKQQKTSAGLPACEASLRKRVARAVLRGYNKTEARSRGPVDDASGHQDLSAVPRAGGMVDDEDGRGERG